MNDKLANPAPLGLMGFGMTTVLLNIHNAGVFRDVPAMIWAMGIFYGGMAQIFAGLLEFRKGNTFATTAFCSYGLFWISLVALWWLQNIYPELTTPVEFVGWYLFLWGLFTFCMFIGTLAKGVSNALRFVFFTLFVLFWLLAIRDWTGNAQIGIIAGWEGIICGLSAFYLAMAEVINENHGKTVLPI